MKKTLTLLLLLISLYQENLYSQGCPGGGITAGEYARRRNALIAMVDTTSVIILRTPEAKSEYEYMNYRQEMNFLYLTGVEAPGYTLLIVPRGLEIDGGKYSCILFAPSIYLEGSSTFSGPKVPYENFKGPSDTVIADNKMENLMIPAIAGSKTLYYSAPGLDFLHDWLNDRPLFLEKEIQKMLKQTYPGMKISKAAPLLNKLRQVKSPEETDLIRKSIEITGEGIEGAMKACKPGIWEYELQAEVEYGIIRNGGEKTAFRCIIGAGKNSLSPHYDNNNCRAQAGEVVVMDVVAEYHNYAADITRTIPVSGKFTGEQRSVYETVLQTQKKLIAMIKPGVSYSSIDDEANKLLVAAGYKKYILHGVTHPIGLDVHDVQTSLILEPGMIITIEPGLYIPENDSVLGAGFRGTGIRIEDDVLVTEDGCEVLSKGIPKEVSEIERIMK